MSGGPDFRKPDDFCFVRHQCRQPLQTILQRQISEVEPVELQEIEGDESDLVAFPGLQRRLQIAEAGAALFIEHHRFAIEHEILGGEFG